MVFEPSAPWLTAMLSTVDQAVIAIDTQNRVLHMNGVAEQLTGWPQAEALGRNVEEICQVAPSIGSVAAAAPGMQAPVSGQPVGGQGIWLIARDATRVPIDVRTSPVLDGQNHLLGLLLVFRDASERKRAQDAAGERQLLLEALSESIRAASEYSLYVQAALDDKFDSVPEAACEDPIAIPRRRAKWLPGVGHLLRENLSFLHMSAAALCDAESYGEAEGEIRMMAVRWCRRWIEELMKWREDFLAGSI